jgi:hypothetical protein
MKFVVQLHFHGIEGVSEDLFRSCLSNRRQKVDIKSPSTTKCFFSDCGTLKYALPQGSILVSVLLIICINALPLRICCVIGTILWIFRKWEGIVGTGWSGLRIGTGGGHL